MNSTEKQQLIELLESSRTEFLNSLDGSGLETHSLRPRPESWSMLECAEHVVLVEQAFLKRLENAPRASDAARHPELEQRIRVGGADRSNRRQAPPPAQPTGRFSSVAEATAHFNESRDRTIQFVQSSEDLLTLSGTHPIFGAMNGYELVLFVCTHSLRHANQIREIHSHVAQR